MCLACVSSNLEDKDDVMTVDVEVKAGPRANRKRKRDQFAWDHRDETSRGGGGGGGEDVSEDRVVLGAGERKCARIGHGRTGPRRRSVGDHKRRPRSVAHLGTRTRYETNCESLTWQSVRY